MKRPEGCVPEWEAAVRHELYQSMLNEVVEETGIPHEHLEPPVCIGIAQRVVNHRPNMMFVIKCRLTAADVLERYAHAADKFESTEMFFLDQATLIHQALQDDSLTMPGCHRGGVELYSRYLEFRDANKTTL